MTDQAQTVRVELPLSTFQKLRHIADVTHRSVEDVLATTIDAALPSLGDVPTDIANDLAALSFYSDAALWSVVETTPSNIHTQRLHRLTADAQNRRLTDAEAAEVEQSVEVSDHLILRRAKAMALLAQRGFDVSARIDAMTDMDDSH